MERISNRELSIGGEGKCLHSRRLYSLRFKPSILSRGSCRAKALWSAAASCRSREFLHFGTTPGAERAGPSSSEEGSPQKLPS